jgi:hypothetical protein
MKKAVGPVGVFPQAPSRLKREQAEKRLAKSNRQLAAVQAAIKDSGGEVSLPITAQDAAAIVGSTHFMHAIADYFESLARLGTMTAAEVSLASVPEETAAAHFSTRRSVEAALYARAERQIQMSVIAHTIDLVLGCPGDNVEVCDVLWRIYEGYQDVEEGLRYQPFEPSGSTGGRPTPERYARRKAAVSAALSAYMLTGLTEAQALLPVMQYVRRVPPTFFGISDMELGQRRAQDRTDSAENTVRNWRSTLKKGRSESGSALAQFRKWESELIQLRRAEPERLPLWAERLLHATMRREA